MKKEFFSTQATTQIWRINYDPLFAYKKRTYGISKVKSFITDYGIGIDRFCIWIHPPQKLLSILGLE